MTVARDLARLLRDAQNILMDEKPYYEMVYDLQALLDSPRARELLEAADAETYRRPLALPAERAGIHD